MDNEKMLDELMRLIAEQEAKEHVRNEERLNDLLVSYRSVKSICRANKVTYGIDYPFKGMGIITVTGKDVTIIDPYEFSLVGKLADNIEVDALVDGTIRLEITFHGLSDIKS